jgi:hypothetical protein
MVCPLALDRYANSLDHTLDRRGALLIGAERSIFPSYRCIATVFMRLAMIVGVFHRDRDASSGFSMSFMQAK